MGELANERIRELANVWIGKLNELDEGTEGKPQEF
jgi:hypothetical protein